MCVCDGVPWCTGVLVCELSTEYGERHLTPLPERRPVTPPPGVWRTGGVQARGVAGLHETTAE